MKASSLVRVVSAVGLTGILSLSLFGCATNTSYTGGVAATVNGVEIQEDTVTSYIEEYRQNQSLTDKASWGEWLAKQNMTPSDAREQVLDYYIEQELLRQQAEKNGITVDENEVTNEINSIKANYESDEAWQEALKQAGYNEETYTETVRTGLMKNQLMETVIEDPGPSQEELNQYAQMYASSYTGAKRSSHILFDSNDRETAQSVLDRINSGELDFAEAAREYSKDGSADSGGDVGWDKLSSFVTEYTDGLNALGLNQVSGLVTSTYGIHIIKCTDVFEEPEGGVTSIDQLPTEFQDSIRQMANQYSSSQAYTTWMENLRNDTENNEIVISEMPSNVPYNVDMSKYSSSSSSSDSAATAESGDTGASTAEGTDTASESGSTDNAAATGSEGAAEAGSSTTTS